MPDHLCRFAVRVPARCVIAVFLGSLVTPAVRSPQGFAVLSGSADGADFPAPTWPTPFNHLFRQMARLPLLRPDFSRTGSDGMLTVSSFRIGSRLTVRPRLTLIRLALIRKPQSSGGGVSHPPSRYLYLHLLFRALQRGSSPAFGARGMLPYRRTPKAPVPRLRWPAYARLLSTPDSSTSELLRTL
jgi:hypothetical protein